jgi:xanthine dehydrogenase YagT iron-sulfur-binding subunit
MDVKDDFAAARRGSKGAPCEAATEPGEDTARGAWAPETQDSIGVERISRRGFLGGAAFAAGALTWGSTRGDAEQEAAEARALAPAPKLPLQLTVNGESKQLDVDPRTSLLDLLRIDLQLTGTKKGCDHGQCGACTVIAGGRRINACLALAVAHNGDEIVTVEGLAHGDALHPVQQAFLDHDGYQCGYCTPGQIVSAVALLDEVKRNQPSYVTKNLGSDAPIELTDDEIKERMSGNICRCGAYPGIVAAVKQAAGLAQGGSQA